MPIYYGSRTLKKEKGLYKSKRRIASKSKKLTTSKVKAIAQKIIDKNTEFKRIVRALPATAVTNITDGLVLWQGPRIPAGTGEMDRNGLEVQLRTLRFKLVFKSIGESNRVRLVLVRYPQSVGIQGNLNDVLVNTSAQNVMISPWLKNGPTKYQIMYNKIHKLGTLGVMDGSYKYQGIQFDVRFPKQGQTLHYDDSTTTNPDKNSFFLYCVADQALASPNQNEVLMYSEATFTDA